MVMAHCTHVACLTDRPRPSGSSQGFTPANVISKCVRKMDAGCLSMQEQLHRLEVAFSEETRRCQLGQHKLRSDVERMEKRIDDVMFLLRLLVDRHCGKSSRTTPSKNGKGTRSLTCSSSDVGKGPGQGQQQRLELLMRDLHGTVERGATNHDNRVTVAHNM